MDEVNGPLWETEPRASATLVSPLARLHRRRLRLSRADGRWWLELHLACRRCVLRYRLLLREVRNGPMSFALHLDLLLHSGDKNTLLGEADHRNHERAGIRGVRQTGLAVYQRYARAGSGGMRHQRSAAITVLSSTSAPLAMSTDLVNSFGEWLMPPMLGTKIIPIGAIRAISCASCPAPLGMR